MSASLSLGDRVLGLDGSNVSQPFGVCKQSCDPKAPKCPKDTMCVELYDLSSQQPLQTYACLPVVKEGQSCGNRGACEAGFACIRYSEQAASWLCQKNCETADDCKATERCLAATPSNDAKVCKREVKKGAACGFGLTCASGSLCVPSRLQEPARCLTACSDKDASACQSDEVCRSFVALGGGSAHACFAKAGLAEPCHGGAACADPAHLCIGITAAYAACFQGCKSNADCKDGKLCEAISDASTITICRTQVKPGRYFLNLTQCENGGRALRLAPEQPPICLPDCTSGSVLAPEYCGTLSSGALHSVHFADAKTAFATGALGIVLQSKDGGSTWSRMSSTTQETLTSSALFNGKVLIAVGQDGRWFSQRFEQQSWTSLALVAKGESALRGVAFVPGAGVAIAVGDKGIWTNAAPYDTPTKQDTSGLSGALLAIAVEPSRTDQMPSVSVAVGEKGEMWRSEDAGKTWKRVTPSGVSADFQAITWHRGTPNAALQVVAVGREGAIFRSLDRGVTWTKMTSPTTQHLLGVVAVDDAALIVGANGVLLRWDGRAWQEVTLPDTLAPPTLRAIAMTRQRAVAVGDNGVSLWSEDGGRKWKYTASQLLACLRIQLPAAADAGACALLCEPTKQGADCPSHLPKCGEVTLDGKTRSVCMPGGRRAGQAGQGAACSPYEGAPEVMRCADALRCLQTSVGHRCLRPCSSGADTCSQGTTCVESPTLKGSFCGVRVGVGELCAPEASRFCEKGARCHFSPLSQTSVCRALNNRKEGQFCSSSLSCEPTLLCSGSAATPYRQFCARRCDWKAQKGCDAGWTCLPNEEGIGSCVESCQKEGDTCAIKGLLCRRPFATSADWFCL